jgi:hypothetical protein
VDQLALPTDSSGFVRRECPHCARQFKSRPGKEEARALLARLAELAGQHCDLDLTDQDAHYCVYCGRSGAPDAWWTPQQESWLQKVAVRLKEELRFQALTVPFEGRGAAARRTFVAVRPSAPWPRLWSEPDDLRRVPFVCCGEEAKVLPQWTAAAYCPRCGARHGRRAKVGRLPPAPASA